MKELFGAILISQVIIGVTLLAFPLPYAEKPVQVACRPAKMADRIRQGDPLIAENVIDAKAIRVIQIRRAKGE